MPSTGRCENQPAVGYSASELLRLRQTCRGIPRRLKRFLFLIGILNRCDAFHVSPIPVLTTARTRSHVLRPPSSSQPLHRFLRPFPRAERHLRPMPIPVRITRRSFVLPSLTNQKEAPVKRFLVIPDRQPLRKGRQKKRTQRVPSLFLTNARSIIGKIDEVGFRLSKHQPQIAVFTETWLDESIPDEAVSIDDYLTIRKDRNRHGGGILCYINRRFLPSGFVPRILSTSDVPSIGECASEVLSIVIPRLLVVAVYHPFWDSAAEHESCISCITDVADFVFSSILDPSHSKLIVCGDFNGLRHHYQEIADLLNVKAIIEFPTRENNILDQVFTDFCVTKQARRLPPMGKSDHVSILWDQEPVAKQPSKLRIRCFSNANMSRFDCAMLTTDWLSLVQSLPSIDEAASALCCLLWALYDTHFPTKTIRKRCDDPPWMKPSLNILIDRRDRAFCEGKKLKYLRLRQQVIQHTKELKRKFVSAASSKQCSSRMWGAIKNLCRSSNRTVSPMVSSAEAMNCFFAASFSEAQDPVANDNSSSGSALSRPLVVTPHEVQRLLRSTKKKSPGPDGIPHWILKKYAGSLSASVAFLLNQSFESGRVPGCFKEAVICPVPKKPHPSTPGDYRPISLLPLLSKVAEKIVADKWVKPCIRGRIQANQFAYVPGPGKGTVAALTLLYHQVLSHLDRESGAVRLLSVDFRKAFDKLPHQAIRQAMTSFNFPCEAISWITDFLSDRRQRTRVNGSLSDWVSVTSGVPQGSVLGPLLFCVVLDNLSPRNDNSVMIKYADDVSILHFVRSPGDDCLQSEWDHITSWASTTGLPVNDAKCAVLDFTTKRKLSLSPVRTSFGSVLPCVTSLKLLGVTLSCDMRWHLHIENVIAKVSKRFFILRLLRKSTCPVSITQKAYIGLIRPLLLYCYPAMCNMPLSLSKKLERVERRASRIIGDAPNERLLGNANSSCARLFSQVAMHPDHPLRQCFLPRIPSTRNRRLLRPPLTKTARFKNSFIKFANQ